MTQDEFRKLLANLKTWKRSGQRAPHKPLLILLALGLGVQGIDRSRLLNYRDIEEPLKDLLKRFGPPRKRFHPELPFQYLVNDGLWKLEGMEDLPERKFDEYSSNILRRSLVRGGLPQEVWVLLDANPPMLRETVRFLLDQHFPDSYHKDILDAVGLDEFISATNLQETEISETARVRSPKFRLEVIEAYEYRCVVCGYDIRIHEQLMGLEAAHIQWHAHGGPDQVPNGLALCVMHHKAFDRGGISLNDNHELLISSQLHGQPSVFEEWFWQYADKPIRSPRLKHNEPNFRFLKWHRTNVFQGRP